MRGGTEQNPKLRQDRRAGQPFPTHFPSTFRPLRPGFRARRPSPHGTEASARHPS